MLEINKRTPYVYLDPQSIMKFSTITYFPVNIYRRWSFMVPWIIIYGINILGLFTVSIVIFYSAEGGMKAFGVLPLFVGLFLLIGHFAVLYFLMEQRSDFLSGACNNIVSEASSPAQTIQDLKEHEEIYQQEKNIQ